MCLYVWVYVNNGEHTLQLRDIGADRNAKAANTSGRE